MLGWDRSQFITRGRDTPPDGFDRDFAELVARRVQREPVAMIVGHREFWNLEFEVTRDVLVPRPETELIIEIATELAAEGLVWRRIIDVGTGSGCLAISLATEFPKAHVVATDVSAAALALARRNAERHGVAGRLTFIQSNLLDDVRETAELIVSNPPYLADSDVAKLQPEVARYEPREALVAGPDGLSVIRRLFETVPARLAVGGRLVVEFGFGQAARVAELASAHGWRVLDIRRDLQQIPRTIVLGR